MLFASISLALRTSGQEGPTMKFFGGYLNHLNAGRLPPKMVEENEGLERKNGEKNLLLGKSKRKKN